MARPKLSEHSRSLDLSKAVNVEAPKVSVPGCYGDFSAVLCGSEPFCGVVCAGKCQSGVALNKRFQVWILHPESDCEQVECTFDTVLEARRYVREQPEQDGGLAWYELRDKTGAPVLDFFEDGDQAL